MQRPVFLQLYRMRFPITAISSILHRLSGILLAFLLPCFLCLIDKSLRSPESFQYVQHQLSTFGSKLFCWMFLSALAYHSVAGVRHLLMDVGIGETLCGGRLGAKLVIVISALVIVGLGVWIW